MVKISINNGQLVLDGKLIDLGHLVNKAEIHNGVLIVKLSTIHMDDEQMRRNIWGLDPLTGKVLWQIQNRLLPGEDPNVIAPDPFTGFHVKENRLFVNTAIGCLYSLNSRDGTVIYDSYVG